MKLAINIVTSKKLPKKLNQILMFYEETPEYLFIMSAKKKSQKKVCHLVIRKQ